MSDNRRISRGVTRKGLSPSMKSGIIARGRLAARARQQEQNIVESQRKQFNKLVDDVNAGRIKSTSQLPKEFVEITNLSQSDLDKINSFRKQQGDIKLWDEAYKLADRVLSSKDARAIFAIGFSKNPYAKAAYRDLQQNQKAFKERQNIIRKIRQGKITNTAISGGRIFDTKTGKPITPAVASNRDFYLGIQKTLPKGEKLLVDNKFNITGIQSSLLQKSFALTPGNIKQYNLEIARLPVDFMTAISDKLVSKRPDKGLEAYLKRERNGITTEINRAKVNLRTKKDLSVKDYYQNIAQWAGGTIAKTIIDAGLGGKDLIIALKNDPETTLKALPPAVLATLKNDFKRATSRDPFALGEVALEYATFAGIGTVASKAVRVTRVNKVFLGVARQFSPKYFNKLISKSMIPPITLRRVVRKTALGRKVDKAAGIALKNTFTAKQFRAYSAKLKAQKKAIDSRLNRLNRKTKKVKKKVETKITRLKTKVQLKKDLKAAKKLRKKSLRRGVNVLVGRDTKYTQAKVVLEFAVRKVAEKRANDFLALHKKRGGKLGLGQKEDFIRAVRRRFDKKLKDTPEWKELTRLEKLNEGFAVTLIKKGKIQKAFIIAKRAINKIKKLKLIQEINSIFKVIARKKRTAVRKIKKPIKKTKKAVRRRVKKVGAKKKALQEKARIKKRRVIKKVKRPFLVAAERRRIKKTIKYRLEQQRPVRQVTIKQLAQARDISTMNKFIDRLFKELEARQKITVSPKTYSQMKNILKKRMRRAIKAGDKAELMNFANAVKKLARDMTAKSSRPTVRMKPLSPTPTKAKKRIMTIKDFETSTPKGTYQEVKSGQTVLLQKVKTKTKTKQAQVTKAKIVSVQKKKISLNPLVAFAARSITLQASKSGLLKGTATKQASALLKDFKTVQTVANKLTPRLRIKPLTITRTKTRPKLKTVQKKVARKKKVLVPKRPIKKTKKVARKKKVQGYVSSVKRKGKRKLNQLPLTKVRALDILAYSLDKSPATRGRMVKSIKRVKRSVLQRQLRTVPKGYFQRNRKKFMLKKLKKGRETIEVIEKKKYRRDSKEERKIKRKRTKK